MAADTLKLLEFDQLLSLLGRYIASPLGKAKLAGVSTGMDLDSITAREERSSEAREYLRSSQGKEAAGNREAGTAGRTLPLTFSDFTDPIALIQKAAIEGVVLEIPEIA